ncbi:MAG: glycogen synthase GlgA [Verrucomicrobia bacterium]|nr:glycogen synthase GlgA [Verrucomicrobiota bacterium]
MRVLIASSEVHPFSKTGGLADMVAALAKSLARAGIETTVLTPLYRGIAEKFPDIAPTDYLFDVPLGAKRVQAGLRRLPVEERLEILFLDQPGYFSRPSLYQENGADFADNAERFIFFAKCVAHFARYSPAKPDVVHLHDWQAGLVPLLILDQRLRDGWSSAPRTCFTIHNLAFQGNFPRSSYALTNLPADYFHPGGVEFYGGLNCLKAGIAYADFNTTVSPRYAREIMTEAYGCGLDGVLRGRQDALAGILNGVDYDEWTTTKNPFLKHPFTARQLAGKAKDKLALQAEMGLPQNAGVPLFGSITRLTDQKGIDIQLGALEEMLAAKMQFVLLGSGAPEFERACQQLAHKHQGRAAVRIGYDAGLAHRIEAGCDFFLMPSRFEPCGLNQMYSLRYGTIPIVRRTGGLDDSVIDAGDDDELADGIKFSEYSARALAKAIRKALLLYEDKKLLRFFRRNAMTADFSWERTTAEYLRVYQRARGLAAA